MTTVIVNGTFDILHFGHLKLLAYAKSLGDTLIVAIDTDDRIKLKKGPGRPVNNQFERFAMMSAIKYVDQVTIFSSDEELIDIIRNGDILVKGSDYRGKSVIGEANAKQVVYFERIDGYSTTNTIQHIIDRR